MAGVGETIYIIENLIFFFTSIVLSFSYTYFRKLIKEEKKDLPLPVSLLFVIIFASLFFGYNIGLPPAEYLNIEKDYFVSVLGFGSSIVLAVGFFLALLDVFKAKESKK